MSATTAANSRHLLPIIAIQPTFVTVISEVNLGIIPYDTFWISCYKESLPSVHTKVRVQLDETDRDVVNLEPGVTKVQIRRQDNVDSYTVACSSLDIPHTRILLPAQEYADKERSHPQHPQRITAFDVSPDGTQFTTGFHDGSVHIYSASPPAEHSILVKRTSKPHLSSVTSLRFFPSSRVLLTAGADFALNILPADPAPPDVTTTTRVSPVRTLRGHTRAITSTGIVSRGRNIVSGSKDGTVRLWDVNSAQQLHTAIAGKGKYTPVLSMSLGERGEGQAGIIPTDTEFSEDSKSGDESKGDQRIAVVDEREVDTSNKVVFWGLGDGSFEEFDLRLKTSVFQSTETRAPLTSILYSPSHLLLATGSVDGTVTVFDTRRLSTPLMSFYRNTASIEDLAFCSFDKTLLPSLSNEEAGVGVVVATEDGLPFIASVLPEGPTVFAELVGGDCDGVRAVRTSGNGVIFWTASDDGIVRKY